MPLKSLDSLPIIDAPRSLEVHILPSDIEGATTKDPSGCVVARSLCREHHVAEARIHLGRVYIRQTKNSKTWVRYITPPAMRSEIIAFDRGGTFVPGIFLLRAPQPTKRLGKARGSLTSKTKPRPRRPKKRRSPTVILDVRHGPASHISES